MTVLEFWLVTLCVVVIVGAVLVDRAKGSDAADEARARRRLLDELHRHGGGS